MASYPALIRKNKDRLYQIDFPDFPGCGIAHGKTMAEAMRRAAEALDRYAANLNAAGDRLPEPTPLGTVAACRDANGAVVSLIPLRAGSKSWRKSARNSRKAAC